MIHHLRGRLWRKSADKLVLDVGGLGLTLATTLTTFTSLPSEGEEVMLYTFLYLREQEVRLYGFASREERDFFEVLLSVRGIGPALALSILSSVTLAELEQAILREDVAFFQKLKGLGKKTAKKVLLELREIFEKRGWQPLAPVDSLPLQEVVAALTALGFDEGEARQVTEEVLWGKPSLSIEEAVRLALQKLSQSSS